MDDQYESALTRCSSKSEIREKAKVHKLGYRGSFSG